MFGFLKKFGYKEIKNQIIKNPESNEWNEKAIEKSLAKNHITNSEADRLKSFLELQSGLLRNLNTSVEKKLINRLAKKVTSSFIYLNFTPKYIKNS